MDYLANLATTFCIFGVAILAFAFGPARAGLVSLMQAALLAVGAYASAIVVTRSSLPFGFDLAVAAVCTASIGYAASSVMGRMRGESALLATLAIQESLLIVLGSADSLTNGMRGISGVRTPRLLAAPGSEVVVVLLTAAVALGLVWCLAARSARTLRGRVLSAIGENELFVVSIGFNADRAISDSVVACAMLTGLAGGLLAHHYTFVGPESFGMSESLFILTAAAVGGSSSTSRALLGVAFMIGLPELLRFFGMPDAIAAYGRDAVFGAALVVVSLRKRSSAPTVSVPRSRGASEQRLSTEDPESQGG